MSNQIRMNRRGALALGGSIAAGISLAACSGGDAGGSGGKEKTLVVSSFYELTTSGWDSMIAGFKKTHPDVTIKTQVTTNSDNYISKILAAGASGTLPDVIGCENSTMFPYFQSKGVLAALDDNLQKDADFRRDSFFPKIIGRYTVAGKIFGIPYDCQPVCGVFLNKALFKKAGLQVPDNSWSWQDMLDVAGKLTRKSGDRIVQYGLDPGGNWLNWLYAYGGRQVDNVDEPTKVLFDTPEAIAGMQAYLDLILRYRVAPSQVGLTNSGQSSKDLFVNGKSAMFVSGYWNVVFDPKSFAKMELGYVMLPAGPAGERAFSTGGTCYAVSSGSKNAQLAFEFVQYWMGMAGWKAAAAQGQPIYPPAYIPAYKEVFLQGEGKDKPVENKDNNGKASEFALFQPRDPAWTEIDGKYITPQEQLLEQGKSDVASTMKSWSAQFTPMLTANK